MTELRKNLLDLLTNDPKIREIIKYISREDINTADHGKEKPVQGIGYVNLHQDTEKINKLVDDKERENQKLLSEIEHLKTNISDKNQENSEKINGLQQELEGKQQMIEMLKKLLGCNKDENLQPKLEQLQANLESLSNESQTLEKKITEKDSRIEEYEILFKEEIEAHKLFENLSSNTKKSLSGIFKDDSITGFVTCGVQEISISNLWEYIKNEVIEDKNNDLSSLNKIFGFLFSRYIIAYPIYELQHVVVGDEFDTQSHIKHSSSSNVSGKVQEVCLVGWVNKKTDKIVKQSVVII